MSEIVDILDDNQYKKILQSDLPVLADFWAPWCNPCIAMGQTISQVAKYYAGHVIFIKVNIEKLKNIASKYDIRSIPQCILFHKGQVLDTIVGLQSQKLLKDFVDKNLPR